MGWLLIYEWSLEAYVLHIDASCIQYKTSGNTVHTGICALVQTHMHKHCQLVLTRNKQDFPHCNNMKKLYRQLQSCLTHHKLINPPRDCKVVCLFTRRVSLFCLPCLSIVLCGLERAPQFDYSCPTGLQSLPAVFLYLTFCVFAATHCTLRLPPESDP